MAKTIKMNLIELMVLKEDIQNVLAYLGSIENFQFKDKLHAVNPNDKDAVNPDAEIFNKLQQVRMALDIPDLEDYTEKLLMPDDSDYEAAVKMIDLIENFRCRENDLKDELTRVSDAYSEAVAFSNLQVSYSELENLSFISMRIGKIDPVVFDSLKFDMEGQGVLIQLGEDKTKVLAACQKKSRFTMDKLLRKYDFVEIEVSRDFKGVPENMLETLKSKQEECTKLLDELSVEKKNYAETHKEALYHLLQLYSVSSQVRNIESSLESTQLVYCIKGWMPQSEVKTAADEIERITNDRTGIRCFEPEEIPSVADGHEKVPVKLVHGKFVKAFERMIFSYGSPLYGTVDPTPLVAIFFTLLFGIMFGDAGQGFIIFLMGILMAKKVIKVGGWNKFAPIFMAVGCTSMIMGLLTGEVFGNEEILAPFSRWVTGLFGEPRDQIIKMMPSGDAASIKRMFIFFGFSVGVGFIINSVGFVVNIINKFMMHKPGKAIFGKTGISGTLFFWYVIYIALKLALFGGSFEAYDGIIIGITLVASAFSEPLSRIVDGEKPVLENGVFSAFIEAIVETLELVSSNLSNTVSFLRVGAFALAHAVLGFIIEKMTGIGSPVVGIFVMIVGNAVVILLEGMIVTIQVIRLQYYEFFSKFFSDTGKEFVPFKFTYKSQY